MLVWTSEVVRFWPCGTRPIHAPKDSVEAKRVPVLEEVANPTGRVNAEHVDVEIAVCGPCVLSG